MQRVDPFENADLPAQADPTWGRLASYRPNALLARASAASRRPFVRSVAAVATGTAAAQAVTMLFAPLVARLYGPEAFGLLGTFTAVLGVLTPIAALTYPIAIVLPKQDADARAIVKLSLLVALGMATLFALVLLVANDLLVHTLQLEAIGHFMVLLPLAMFFSACLDVADQWRIRKKQFRTAARIAVLQSLILNACKAGFGWFNPVAAVLIVITTLGYALYAAMLAIGMKLAAPVAQAGRAKSSAWALAREHYDFPLFRAPQALINAASLSLPVLMLASFSGPAAAGFYTLARTVLAMPARLIGKSVGDVFYPRFTEAAHKGENLGRLILKATGGLALTGLIPFGTVIAFGPWLFGLVFGADWVVAGEYARWLALWAYFGFLNRPSVSAVATLSLQGFFLIYEGVSLALRTAALLVGFLLLKSDVAAVAAFSIVGALLNAALVQKTIIACRHRSGPRARGAPAR